MNYQPYQHNYTGKPKIFVLDKMKLSAIDKEVLKAMCFPAVITQGQVLQKRVAKVYVNGGYTTKSRIEAEDIKYVVVPRSVAEQQIKKFAYDPNDARAKQQVEEVLRPKPRDQYYIDGDNLEKEVKWLLKQFSAPSPTPNAYEDAEDLDFEDVEETPAIEQPKEDKPLSAYHKGKIRKMSEEESKDAGEIAEALKLDVNKVIAHLKKIAK